MAAKTTKGSGGPSFTQILADIRKRQFAPIYLLSGPEGYFIDRIAEALQTLVVSEDAKDFDLTLVYGADTNGASVANEARRFPMMGEKTLVILREAQAMHDAKNQIEKLASYAAAPAPSTVLVIAWKGEPLKASSALVKNTIKNGGVVFESQKPKEWQLEKYLEDYCRDKNIRIDHASVALLVSSIGNDLSRLFGETDKLLIASGGEPITPALIEKNIGISKDFNNFELVAALSQRNYPKAMQIVSYFEGNPKANPTIVTATVLFNFFSNLLLAHYAPDKSERGLMAQLKFHSPYQLTDINRALPMYKAGNCIRIIHAVREFDCRIKGIGSVEKDYDLLKELIYKIFTL